MIAANYDIHIGILSVITGEILSNRQCVTNIANNNYHSLATGGRFLLLCKVTND